MMVVCPSCKKEHDTITRQLYDQFQCSCGTWLMIAQHRSGTWHAVRIAPPTDRRRG